MYDIDRPGLAGNLPGPRKYSPKSTQRRATQSEGQAKKRIILVFVGEWHAAQVVTRHGSSLVDVKSAHLVKGWRNTLWDVLWHGRSSRLLWR